MAIKVCTKLARNISHRKILNLYRRARVGQRGPATDSVVKLAQMSKSLALTSEAMLVDAVESGA